MFFNKKLHAKIASLELVVSKQTNTIDQLMMDKHSLKRQVMDLHDQRNAWMRQAFPTDAPGSASQFHPMGNQGSAKKTHTPARPPSTSSSRANSDYQWPTATHSPAIPDTPSFLRHEPSFSGGGGSFGGGGASGNWTDSSASGSSSSCDTGSSDSGSSSCASSD